MRISPYALLTLLLVADLLMPARAARAEAVSTPETEPAPEILTLRQALSEALRTHPLIRAAEQRLRFSEAHARGAGAPLNPEARIQHGFGQETGGLDDDVQLSQTFELRGKRQARAEVTRQEAARATADLDAARLQVTYDTITAYLGVQEATAIRLQSQRFLDLAEQFRAATEEQYKVGEVPRTRLLRSEIEVSAQRQTLEGAAADLTTQTATMNSLIGRPLDTPLSLAEPLSEPTLEPDLQRWKERAAARPELASARAALAARQAGIRSARSEALPDLYLTGTHGHLDQWPGNSILVGIVFTPFDRGLLRSKRDEARASTAEQEATLADLQRQTDLAVQTAYDQAVSALTRMNRYRTEQLEKARTLADLAREGYAAGITTYLELLDAQNVLQDAEAGYVRSQADAARAQLSLERAAGMFGDAGAAPVMPVPSALLAPTPTTPAFPANPDTSLGGTP